MSTESSHTQSDFLRLYCITDSTLAQPLLNASDQCGQMITPPKVTMLLALINGKPLEPR
ncbi:MAG: hypothetical protein ABIF04_01540 [Chloroflexota bacterium]